MEQVLKDVKVERIRQDNKWGGPEHDDTHSTWYFIALIRDKIRSIRNNPFNTRKFFIQIAALAVAAVERIDRQIAQAKE